jgi:hypothetical protein
MKYGKVTAIKTAKVLSIENLEKTAVCNINNIQINKKNKRKCFV